VRWNKIKLEIWGKAKREAAWRRKSDWGSLGLRQAVDYKCGKIPFPLKPFNGSR